MNRLSEQVHDFNEECISHGRRTRIFDADGITKLSMEGLLKILFRMVQKIVAKPYLCNMSIKIRLL